MRVFWIIVLLSVSNIVFARGKYDRDKFISNGLHADRESASLSGLEEYTGFEIGIIKNAVAGSAAEWKKDMLDKIRSNNLREVFTNDNQRLLRRYAILNIEEESQKSENDGTYINVNDLKQELERLQEEKSQMQDALLTDFIEKWGIEPGGSLFDDYIEKYPSNIIEASESKFIDGAKYYGKNEEIKKSIESYKAILDIYQELKGKLEGKSPEDNTKQYFNRNIGHFANQIRSMVSNEKGNYKNAESDYNKKLKETEVNTNRKLEERTNSVTIDGISPSTGFDYYSGNEVSSLFLGANDIKLSEEVLEFKTKNSKGETLNVKIMGFLEKYIYICRDGKITLYDPFTLQPIKEEEAFFDAKGKTVLFINDTEKNIIVVKNRKNFEYMAIDMKESGDRITFTLKEYKPE
jgi:hypothetical protein